MSVSFHQSSKLHAFEKSAYEAGTRPHIPSSSLWINCTKYTPIGIHKNIRLILKQFLITTLGQFISLGANRDVSSKYTDRWQRRHSIYPHPLIHDKYDDTNNSKNA